MPNLTAAEQDEVRLFKKVARVAFLVGAVYGFGVGVLVGALFPGFKW